ncbi:MAG: carbohydrate kinase family protein [Aigarchaeota archaeon]|nr:carbohydrate kinase family protein [Aigarchaeota archaeon]
MRDRIVAVGEVAVDVIATGMPRIPKKWSEVEIIENFGVYPAGSAGYFAQCLARLGMGCSIVGKIGADQFGEFLLAEFQKEKVDTRFLKISKTDETAITLLLVLRNRKKISFVTRPPRIESSDIDFGCLAGASHLHFSGYLMVPSMWGRPTITLMKRAREEGLQTSLDTQMSITGNWRKPLSGVLEHVDLLFLDQDEARKVSGVSSLKRAGRILLKRGPRTVVVKLGKRGCRIFTGDEDITVPGYTVKALSTVGAGDAFDAGYLYSTTMNWPLTRRGAFANAVAALSCTAMGCKHGIKSATQAMRFIGRKSRN